VDNNADNHSYATDDIDLRQLIETLWTSRWLIIIVALTLTCAAIVYAFFSTPIYQTTAQTLPPTASGLASYNVASQLTGSAIRGTASDIGPGIEPLTPQEAYKVFLRYLNSNTIRQDFFTQYYLPAQEEKETERDKQEAWKELNKDLTIRLPQKADELEASVSIEGSDPKAIAHWTNAYVDLAISATTQDFLERLTGEVKIREQSLEDQIVTLRRVAAKIREDQMTRLREALSVAESIGLESPAEGAPIIAQNINTEDIRSGSLLYLRGAKALRSELEILEQRKSDDAYIAELPNLLKQQALLAGIDLDPTLLSIVTVDRSAIVPEEPIKPNKPIVIILGLVLGLILGTFIALFRKLIAQR